MIREIGIHLGILIICLGIGIKNTVDFPQGVDSLVIEAKCVNDGASEIFYDNGEGFAAERCIQGNLTGTDVWVEYMTILPAEPYTQLRWDPPIGEDGNEIVVRGLKLKFNGGKIEELIDPEYVVIGNDVASLDKTETGFEFVVDPDCTDPYLLFVKLPERPEPPTKNQLLLKGSLFSLLAALLLSAIYRVVIWYFNS